jgi:hypothetical protein
MEIPERLQCTPHLNSHKVKLIVDEDGPRPGTYRGFCLLGKPDGRGEWRDDKPTVSSYCGEWQAGVPHGVGHQVMFYGAWSLLSHGFSNQDRYGEFCHGSWVRPVERELFCPLTAMLLEKFPPIKLNGDQVQYAGNA